MSDSSDGGCGISLGGVACVLTIVFMVLKYTDVIDWSWFWVLSPLIFVAAGAISLLLSTLLVLLVITIAALFIGKDGGNETHT